jgi:hypothetical protein
MQFKQLREKTRFGSEGFREIESGSESEEWRELSFLFWNSLESSFNKGKKLLQDD